MKIGGRELSVSRSFVIAEVAQAHEGSLTLACSYIDAAAKSGADAVKFQTHLAEAESTVDEPFRSSLPTQDLTRREYWKRMEFSRDGWEFLREYASEKGLAFLSSPFSADAVQLLESIDVDAIKIGSGEVFSRGTLHALRENEIPVILSSGMSDFGEIDASISELGRDPSSVAVLQCSSRYPNPLSNVGLNVMEEIRTKFGCVSGISDHSGTIWPSMAAIALGAEIVEIHVTFSRDMLGYDVSSSVTFEELALICSMRDACEEMLSNPVDKSKVPQEQRDLRPIFTKSLAPRRFLPKGTTLSADMLTEKKPGTGINPAEIPQIVGMRLLRDVGSEELLSWDMLGSGS